MLKTFLLSIFVFTSLCAKDIYPTFRFKSVGFVSDFVIEKNYLYVANDMSTIDIFDLNTKKIINQIKIPYKKAFDGELKPTQILSIDVLDGKILFTSDGKDGYRDAWIYEDYELKNIINSKDRLMIKEANFINKDKIIFATLDSDIVLYDEEEKFQIYNKHISHSFIGDITLNKDKTELITVDESGTAKIINLKDGKVIQEFKSENVDNIFHVAFSKGTIITAGQDRRVAVYQKDKKAYHIKSSFLVFCVGISPSANLGVYSSGEENYLQTFNIKTKQNIDRLIGHTKIINQIKFTSEKSLFTSERGTDILFWTLD